MTIELNQQTFKRLVQLYFLSVVLGISAAAYEGVVWADFSTDFDKLVEQHFGGLTDTRLFVMGGFIIIGLVAHFAATISLMRFRPWARTVFWASLLLFLPLGFVPPFSVYWTSFLSSLIEDIGSMLFGMILLLAYSRDYGANWFRKELKEPA